MIERIGYDDGRRRLCIAFRDTGRYYYHDVPADLFEAFCEAPSAGTFFNRHIKDRFHYTPDPARKRFGPKARRFPKNA